MMNWMKIMLVFLIFTGQPVPVSAVTIPPRPAADPDEHTISIAVTNREWTVPELEKLIASSELKIRHVYRNALKGFSIEGKRADVEGFKNRIGNEGKVYDSFTYKASVAESVPFIGGKEVRKFFDKEGRRLTGKGVKVGVIDTGIDYTHPDLRNNYKGGKDLVDGDLDPMETRQPELFKTLHGTHVAGIIAANGKVKGVAPEAGLYAYRALGPGGSGSTESVIAAIEAAMEDKMDIINLSLGNDVNGPDLPITIALNNAVDSGITAVVSSGNSGPGVWTLGSPGTSSKAISVGASSPPLKIPLIQVGIGATGKKIPLSPLGRSATWNFKGNEQVVDGGKGRIKDLKDAEGKLVLIQRGGSALSEKAENARKCGAKGIVFYNNSKGNFLGLLDNQNPLPAVSISKEDGIRMKEEMDGSGKMEAKMIYEAEADRLAAFSSRGPVTVSWEIKPDVVAPGVSIDSTIPGGYLALNGTSMSAPHVAGAAALLKQSHPDWGPTQMKSALMTTSTILKEKNGEPYRTYEQGSGRINLAGAVAADTLLYPNSMTFGVYDRHKGSERHRRKLTIENQGKTEKHYSFRIPKKIKGLNWKMPSSFSLKPGEKQTVSFGLTIDSDEIEKGVHDGFVHIMEGGNDLHIPFLYLKDEPDHPRMMGFQFVEGDSKDLYRYEMYLPSGGEELAIALYELDSMRFAGFLDHLTPSPRGLVQRDIPRVDLPHPGEYMALIYIKNGKRNDIYRETIIIEEIY